MYKEYKYHFSHHTISMTILHILVFIVLGLVLYYLYGGGYLSAWFTTFVVALIALMVLSIPRKIIVRDKVVEIRCLLDITEIRKSEIASVRRVKPSSIRWFLPIFGARGFFGYYGHFLDLKHLDRVRIYASELKNIVEIIDIYEERLYVSCSDADSFIAELTPPGGNRETDADEEEEEERIPDTTSSRHES